MTQSRMRTGVPPSTGMRTGVPPGTAGRQAAYGQSLATEVHVSDRPVTGQGMMGMRTGSQGPGRSVQDRSYFLGLFRNKVGDITNEVRELEAQTSQYKKDDIQSTQLEKNYNALLKDVREYEGQLADYNLAMDKSRTGTDPEEIMKYREHLEEQNRHQSQEVDSIFEKRQDIQSRISSMHEEIEAERRRSEQKINELAPDKARRYRELMEENKEVLGHLQHKYTEHNEVSQQLAVAEGQLGADSLRETHARLTNSVSRLRKEKAALQEEARTTTMDPEEARTIMLQKVKDDKLKLDSLSQDLQSVEENNMKLKKVLSDLNTDLAERKSEGGDSQKYDVLFERDKEMTAFIDAFEETRQKELDERTKIQETVVGLLEHISEGLGRTGAMPSQSRVAEMRDDLSFKQRQLDSAASTKTRLETELKKKNQELEKINTLDEKISVELASLHTKIKSMQEEIVSFNQKDRVKSAASDTESKLRKAKLSYVSRRDNIKQQTNLLRSEYEQKKSALQENETAKGMEALENKLRHYEQNIFHLREFIETKEHETNYVALKDECMGLVNDLNKRAIAQVAAAPMNPGPSLGMF